MIPFLEFQSEFRRLEPEIRHAVNEVLESGWFVLGKQLSAFETEFAEFLGAAYAVGVGSGTDAIHLALRAAGIGPGDEVITAANTCVPTAAGVGLSGAQLALADIDPETMTLSAPAVERAVTSKTKAIVPVHLYGHPCDMDALSAVARTHGLDIVEDCAQAHGAQYKGRSCGLFSSASAFSFYPTKNLGAYGDAGAVVTQDEDIAQALRKLRNYGEDRRYYHTCPGVNSRLDEIQAAILRVKLKHLEAANEARRERAALYREALGGLPLRMPPEADWARSNYHLFVVRTPRARGRVRTPPRGRHRRLDALPRAAAPSTGPRQPGPGSRRLSPSGASLHGSALSPAPPGSAPRCPAPYCAVHPKVLYLKMKLAARAGARPAPKAIAHSRISRKSEEGEGS